MGDIHPVDSPYDHTDVQTAIDAASAGDTVTIPTCDVTWDDSVTINKPITFQGTGSFNWTTKAYSTGTKITRNGTMVNIDNSSGGINSNNVRVTGIHFDRTQNQTDNSYAIAVDGGDPDQSEIITNLRIDNCRFDWGRHTLNFLGVVFGCVDNNYFYNGQETIRVFGIGDYPWNNYTYAPGTVNMLFFENNHFYWDGDTPAIDDGIFYDINGGARIVVRYNNFDLTDGINCSNMGVLHVYGFWGNDWRMTMLVECYENTATFSTHMQNCFGWRGGSMLLWNNTITSTGGQFAAVGTICGDDVPGKRDSQTARYPMQDQVNNSFVWGNSWNGSEIDSGDITNNSCTPTGDSDQRVGIQGDGNTHTEVWLHEPQSSGGENVYPGSLGAGNWQDSDGTPPLMYFTSDGANAYYPYTAYQYPHPLRGESISSKGFSSAEPYKIGASRRQNPRKLHPSF